MIYHLFNIARIYLGSGSIIVKDIKQDKDNIEDLIALSNYFKNNYK